MEADAKASTFPPQKSPISVCFLEELQKQLLEQVELRKKLEREFQNLKGKLNSEAVLPPPPPHTLFQLLSLNSKIETQKSFCCMLSVPPLSCL